LTQRLGGRRTLAEQFRRILARDATFAASEPVKHSSVVKRPRRDRILDPDLPALAASDWPAE
jgi:hypothetical protein